MEILNKADYSYLLQQSLSDLHRESLSWLSDIEFMETEFNYYRKVLKKYNEPKLPEKFKTVMNELDRKVINLQKEDLVRFRADLKKHESYLRELLESKPGHDDSAYRDRHMEMADKEKQLQQKNATFKKELILFITEIS